MGRMLHSEEGIATLIHSIPWIRNLEAIGFYAITVTIHILPSLVHVSITCLVGAQ
jgi:hypothetical protein